MKICKMWLLLIIVGICGAGCATRIGKSTKLDGYDNKLRKVTVVYNQPKFSDPLITEKLNKHKFQNMEEYLFKTIPTTFSSFGIDASFGNAKAIDLKKLPAEDSQILFIAPTRASSSRPKDIYAIPSMNPIGVDVQVTLIDLTLRKTVWSGQFKIVAGGLLYDHFCEETVTAFLRDIIEKLQDDGLVDKIQS